MKQITSKTIFDNNSAVMVWEEKCLSVKHTEIPNKHKSLNKFDQTKESVFIKERSVVGILRYVFRNLI